MTDNKNDDGQFTISRRDFLKVAGFGIAAVGASYAISPESKFIFNIFAPATDYEQLQAGFQYTYTPNICGICSSTCDIIVTAEKTVIM